jgi:hypothetical protein
MIVLCPLQSTRHYDIVDKTRRRRRRRRREKKKKEGKMNSNDMRTTNERQDIHTYK